MSFISSYLHPVPSGLNKGSGFFVHFTGVYLTPILKSTNDADIFLLLFPAAKTNGIICRQLACHVNKKKWYMIGICF